MVTDYVDFTGPDQRDQFGGHSGAGERLSGRRCRSRKGRKSRRENCCSRSIPGPTRPNSIRPQGQVNLYKAQLELAKANYARDKEVAKTPGAVSVQQLDQDKAAVDEADAAVKAFQASLEVYKLNLSFTKVTSPIDGQVSRYFMTLGQPGRPRPDAADDGRLAGPDVRLLRHGRGHACCGPGGRSTRARSSDIKRGKSPSSWRLQGEDELSSTRAPINFVNNQVNPNTGSISVRGVFANPKPAKGVRLLSPGMFVRVRLPIGQPHPAVLVIDRAIGSDQGLKFVYVVDAKNKVQYRRVSTGALQEDGLRVITEGLKPDEWVVVGGLQQVQPAACRSSRSRCRCPPWASRTPATSAGGARRAAPSQ